MYITLVLLDYEVEAIQLHIKVNTFASILGDVEAVMAMKPRKTGKGKLLFASKTGVKSIDRKEMNRPGQLAQRSLPLIVYTGSPGSTPAVVCESASSFPSLLS